jgi:hypothetical protein
MEIPKIKMNGEIVKPQPPKAKVWREVMRFDEIKKDIDFADFIDAHAEIIALVFGGSITKEIILENLEIEDIVPTYRKCYRWVLDLLTSKLEKIPNGETPEA